MTEPFRNPELSVDERVADLMGRLTPEEKAGQLTQYFYFAALDMATEDVDASSIPPEMRALIEQPKQVEDAVSSGRAGSVLFVKDAVNTNRLQRLAVENSRLGIPLIFGFDVIHGLRTVLPVPIAQAASWDPQVPEDGQTMAAREARAVGIHWAFAPMVDIARDPRWGRIIEGAGEDPVLGAAMAAAQVRGFQGRDGYGAPDRVVAGPKHFAGYGAAVGGRDYDDSDISDSQLWNVYLPPFKAALDAGAGNVMSAYMDLNGVPAVSNRWLLTDVLRDAFGFDGWVVSDANGVRSQQTQHHVLDLADAAARALNAGNDMEMCMFDPAFDHLVAAVESGAVDAATVDESVRRVLTAKFRLGLFEHPYTDEDASAGILDAPEHRDIARRAAVRGAVLLKNDASAGGAAELPIASSIGSIAVIGHLADSHRDTIGPWVFDYDVDETVTILDGIRARAGDGVRVEYAAGYWTPPRVFASMFDQMDKAVPKRPDTFDDQAEFDKAVAVAAASDVAVIVIGQSQNMIGEAASTSTLELPGRQQELVEACAATGTPVVALVMSGRPLDLRVVSEKAASIMQVWYPGTKGGEAVASLLFGDESPAGRLPFTWPRTVGQVPMYLAHYRTFQPQAAGERYWDEASTPLYAFGHGLSYATFSYRNLALDQSSIGVGETAQVSVEVTNTSDQDADEVVQLYIHQLHGLSTRPVRELKGFSRVAVKAGETVTVRLPLGPDQLRYWSAVTRDWTQDATEIEIYVGGSSDAELMTTLHVG